MTPQARMRRIGWFALLAVCTAIYGVLHFQVWSLSSEVRKAERQIVQLEQQKMLLETEFLTRSSQMQLAAWNRVDFGYSAPNAQQFIENERQLARFGSAAVEGSPAPIGLASLADAGEEERSFPQLLSPITGQPVDVALIEPQQDDGQSVGGALVASLAQRTAREPMSASSGQSTGSGSSSTVRIALGGAGQ